jgi:hypothetical protein
MLSGSSSISGIGSRRLKESLLSTHTRLQSSGATFSDPLPQTLSKPQRRPPSPWTHRRSLNKMASLFWNTAQAPPARNCTRGAVRRLPALDACWQARRSVFATRSTANSSPDNPALFAGASRVKRITSDLRNLARLDERSATSSRFQFAEHITASCTAMATRSHGGPE